MDTNGTSLAIIVPAYNEEQRIGRTLRAYSNYAALMLCKHGIKTTFFVVLNGCVDNTRAVVEKINNKCIHIIELKEPGKGLAIAAGFKAALNTNATMIGFVDADMATSPEVFYGLLNQADGYDGVIASRYMKGAIVTPARPRIKRWGSRLFYENLALVLLGLHYKDLQCGAKIFKRSVISAIYNQLKIRQWAFDAELLYLCKRHKFYIHEVPTIWHDQTGSKLSIFSNGMKMICSLVWIRAHYFRK